MNRYVISYKLILSNMHVIFIDFDDPEAIYINEDSFNNAINAAISWIIDHVLDDCETFEICGIKRIYDIW